MIIQCETITPKAAEILFENGFIIEFSPNGGYIDIKDAETIIAFEGMMK